MKKGQAGGIARAVTSRAEARKKYAENPNICLFCLKPIIAREDRPIDNARSKKFCNHSCAGIYRSKISGKVRVGCGICERCGSKIEYKPNKRGGYTPRKFCSECLPRIRAEVVARASEGNKNFILDLTKQELMDKRKGYQNFRSGIQTHARRIYLKSGRDKFCFVCNYNKNFDVAHIIPVSSFPLDTKIGEINRLSNLVALCPNHHWEFDSGELKINIDTIPKVQ